MPEVVPSKDEHSLADLTRSLFGSEEQWIAANVRAIEENGPEVYLRNVLSILKGNYATQEQIGSTPPRPTPGRNDSCWCGSGKKFHALPRPLMLKRQVEIGGEYAWREQYSFSPDEYRKVTLLKFLNKPGGRHALVRDKDGEFETHLERLIKSWSALGPKDKESEFRTRAEKHEHERRLAQERDPVGFEIEESWRALSLFEPGKGGVPCVPEWLPRMFNDMASGVLKLDMGQYQVVQDEQMACYQMLQNMADVCERIRNVAREMLPAWEAEDKEAQYPGLTAEKVQRRLDDGDLPFASSEIMPVYANYGMSRSRATTQYYTGSIVAADFMERVADDYEELDRYASLAVRWGWGFYLRWRTTHEAEMRRAVPRTERRPGRRR